MAFQSSKLGVIDLGTNSIRFDVYEIDESLKITRTYRVKEMVRLGEDFFKTQELKNSAIERTLIAFKVFKDYLSLNPVDKVIAFSTCVLREAKNAQEFIDLVFSDTGIEIEVISGQREAELISLAILANQKLPKSEIFSLIDIGGGSTEFTLTHKRTVLEQDSLALGSSRLKQNFLAEVPSIPQELDDLRKHIKCKLDSRLKHKAWKLSPITIGSSGTAKAIAKMAEARGFSVNPLKLSDLNTMVSEIEFLPLKDLKHYPGMESKRLDIILSGLVLFQEICKYINSKEIYVSEYNLRDGILEEQVTKQVLATL